MQDQKEPKDEMDGLPDDFFGLFFGTLCGMAFIIFVVVLRVYLS